MRIPYVELHCHSGFSFLDGASHPEELILRAKELGYPALALTDHNGLYGSMEFARLAHEAGIQPVTGAEVTLRECFPGPPRRGRARRRPPRHAPRRDPRRVRQPLPPPHAGAHGVAP